MVLPANLPRSSLLSERSSFIDRLHLLYSKYIARGSELEINISSIQRKRIAQSFADVMNGIDDEQKSEEQSPSAISLDSMTGSVDEEASNALNFEMFTLLDKACIEILLLMRQSYERFAARSLPVLKQMTSGGLEMIDYRTQAVKLEILRDGAAYAELREKYEAS